MDINSDLVFHFARVDNTMEEANRILGNLEYYPEQVLVIADEQYSGIGRNENTWQSPPGGLWFTYCVRTDVISHQFALFSGLMLHRVLCEHFPLLVKILKIKWPNDMIIGGKKLSGILVQVKKGYLCMGVGINTNNDEPLINDLLQPVSLKNVLGFEVSSRAILDSFLQKLNDNFKLYEESGISTFLSEINQNLYGKDKPITFTTDSQLVEGFCIGVNQDGAILIEVGEAEINKYYSGAIRSLGE